MEKLFFIESWMKEERTWYTKPIDLFTKWVYEETMSDDFYDDEDRANCYYELCYINFDHKIETGEDRLRLPIKLDSAVLLHESEWKNIDFRLYIIMSGEEDELPPPPRFRDFMLKYYNPGDYNLGDYNRGVGNFGDYNVGDSNIGSNNMGNQNLGDFNLGDGNKSSFNVGCFNTTQLKFRLFNKSSDWTYKEWMDSEARGLLKLMPKPVEWIHPKDMTDEEKIDHFEYERTGGCIRCHIWDDGRGGWIWSDRRQVWWNNLSDEQKNIIKAIPNFDPDIFEQCTGIKVN